MADVRKQLRILKNFIEGFDFIHMKPDSAVVKAGVKKSENSRLFLTGRRFESQDFASLSYGDWRGGVPYRRRQDGAKCFGYDNSVDNEWLTQETEEDRLMRPSWIPCRLLGTYSLTMASSANSVVTTVAAVAVVVGLP